MEIYALSCKLLVSSDFGWLVFQRSQWNRSCASFRLCLQHFKTHLQISLQIPFQAFHLHGISKRFILPIFTILFILVKSGKECRIAHIQFYECFVLTDISNTSLWKTWCLFKSVYYLICPFSNRRSHPSVRFYQNYGPNGINNIFC